MSDESTVVPKSPDFEAVFAGYREMNKAFIDALMTRDRAVKVVFLVNGINAVMNSTKADCLVATLAMAVVIESTFKHVFDGAKPEEKK